MNTIFLKKININECINVFWKYFITQIVVYEKGGLIYVYKGEESEGDFQRKLLQIM